MGSACSTKAENITDIPMERTSRRRSSLFTPKKSQTKVSPLASPYKNQWKDIRGAQKLPTEVFENFKRIISRNNHSLLSKLNSKENSNFQGAPPIHFLKSTLKKKGSIRSQSHKPFNTKENSIKSTPIHKNSIFATSPYKIPTVTVKDKSKLCAKNRGKGKSEQKLDVKQVLEINNYFFDSST